MTDPSATPGPQTPQFLPPGVPGDATQPAYGTPTQPYGAPAAPAGPASYPAPAQASPAPQPYGAPGQIGAGTPSAGAPAGQFLPPGNSQTFPQPLDAARPAPQENVGRGVAFSLIGVVLGAVVSAAIYQAGFLASITSFLMAVAVGWLYTKGAGAPPRKGAPAVIGVIVVGVVVSLFSMLGATLYLEIAADYPTATLSDIMPVVFDNLLYPPVWQQFATDAAIFVVFALLGTFGTLRQLRRGSGAQ